MVGPASPRVADSEGLHLSDRSGEKYRLQAHARGNAQSNWHTRQPNMRHYPGGEYGRRHGQRSSRGADYKAEGVADVNGRNHPPSSATPSGRSEHAPSNEDRFLEVTTPCVKTQNLGKLPIGRRALFFSSNFASDTGLSRECKYSASAFHMCGITAELRALGGSRVRDASQKRCFNPEDATFFSLGDLWDSFDEWSAYGAGVPLVLNGGESVVQYYVPYLSAIELYTLSSRRPDFSTGSRNRGSESDASSEASSDGESEPFRGYKGSENPSTKLGGPLGSSSRMQCRPFKHGDEEGKVWYCFETISPYSRVPLVDKITDLSRDFPRLRTLESHELLPSSFLSVAWYPIYRIPTGPTLRDLDACFLTFHPLSKPLQAEGDASSMSPCRHVRVKPKKAPLGTQALDVFALASYKLRGAVWSSDLETRQELQKSAYDHLKKNGVQHGDLNYFTSHSTPNRR